MRHYWKSRDILYSKIAKVLIKFQQKRYVTFIVETMAVGIAKKPNLLFQKNYRLGTGYSLHGFYVVKMKDGKAILVTQKTGGKVYNPICQGERNLKLEHTDSGQFSTIPILNCISDKSFEQLIKENPDLHVVNVKEHRPDPNKRTHIETLKNSAVVVSKLYEKGKLEPNFEQKYFLNSFGSLLHKHSEKKIENLDFFRNLSKIIQYKEPFTNRKNAFYKVYEEFQNLELDDFREDLKKAWDESNQIIEQKKLFSIKDDLD